MVTGALAHAAAADSPWAIDLAQVIEQLQQEISLRWQETGDLLQQICRYAMFPHGKLFRPILLLEGCIAVDGNPYAVLPAALGAEYGHVASLIHDDIIDRDDMRRGKSSVHHSFGISNAILSGDGLIFHLFQALTECQVHHVPADRIVEACRVVSASGIDLCRGQILEAEMCDKFLCDEATYLQMISLKTAAFFRGAIECGAVLGGGHAEQVYALAQYGEHLGMAFQIWDDLLPYMSCETVTGKSIYSDIKNRRLTLPVIYAYGDGGAADRAALDAIYRGEIDAEVAFAQISAVLERTGAIARARALASMHVHQARALLESLPPTPSRIRLNYYVSLAVNRQL